MPPGQPQVQAPMAPAAGGSRLRDARPATGGASVNATVAFGGIDVLVPKGWRISVRSTPIFGGIDDKTDRTRVPAADAPTLRRSTWTR